MTSPSKNQLHPCRTSKSSDSPSLPNHFILHALSSGPSCDTFDTESRGRPEARAVTRTLPNTACHSRFPECGKHTTEAIRLRFKGHNVSPAPACGIRVQSSTIRPVRLLHIACNAAPSRQQTGSVPTTPQLRRLSGHAFEQIHWVMCSL